MSDFYQSKETINLATHICKCRCIARMKNGQDHYKGERSIYTLLSTTMINEEEIRVSDD